MTTFTDWHRVVAGLREAEGPPTTAQRDLAAKIGVNLGGWEPRGVAAAILSDAVTAPLGLRAPRPATPQQIVYLAALRPADATHPSFPELTRVTASAWISHFLARRTIAALEALAPCRGDLVLYWRRVYDPFAFDRDEPQLREETHVVSSISESGKVNFRRSHRSATGLVGAALAAWPTHLEIVARAQPTTVPSPRPPRARRDVPARGLLSRSRRRRPRSPMVLRLWGRALPGLRHDRDLRLLWASVRQAEVPQSPSEDRDAAEVVEALRASVPDAAIVALLRELADGVAVTAWSSESPLKGDLFPDAVATSREGIVELRLDCDLEALERSLVARVRALQHRPL